jgi:hypothetical protein
LANKLEELTDEVVIFEAISSPAGASQVGIDRLLTAPHAIGDLFWFSTMGNGTGRTVFNNKGNPVKQYEPFFSATFDFEDEAKVVESGVTPIIHYDALDRVVRTELPNGTESRVAFDVWKQEYSEPNDTVLESRWYQEKTLSVLTDRVGAGGLCPPEPERGKVWRGQARSAWDCEAGRVGPKSLQGKTLSGFPS